MGDALHMIIGTVQSQDYTKYILDPEMNLLTDVHGDGLVHLIIYLLILAPTAHISIQS